MSLIPKSISISGVRYYNPSMFNKEVMQMVIEQILILQPYQILFGGAIGIDTDLLLKIWQERNKWKTVHNIDDLFQLKVVCPNTKNELPIHAKRIAEQCADEIIELKNEIKKDDGWASFRLRNNYLIEYSDIIYAFPLMGHNKGGTWDAIKQTVKFNSDHPDYKRKLQINFLV